MVSDYNYAMLFTFGTHLLPKFGYIKVFTNGKPLSPPCLLVVETGYFRKEHCR